MKSATPLTPPRTDLSDIQFYTVIETRIKTLQFFDVLHIKNHERKECHL